MADLRKQFGQLDIYLFDQLLRGRLPAGTRVLEAGCGFGRNLSWLLASGYDVYAADADHEAIQSVRRLAATLAPRLPVPRRGAQHCRAAPCPGRRPLHRDAGRQLAGAPDRRPLLLPAGV
jgi:SAM-dependent methyltransferase